MGVREGPARTAIQGDMSSGYVVGATEEGQKTRHDPYDPHTGMDALR